MWQRVRVFGVPAVLSIMLVLTILAYRYVNVEVPPTPQVVVSVADRGSGSEQVLTDFPLVSTAATRTAATDIPTTAPTETGTPTEMPTATKTATPTRTPLPTDTPKPTRTPTATRTPTRTPTPTPSRTATPTPRPPSIEVLVKKLPVRAGPGTRFRVLYHAHRGDLLIVQSKNLSFDKKPWFLVRVKGGREEWITGDAKSVRHYNTGSLSSRKGPATYTPIPPTRTPTPVVLASSVRDFSNSQSAQGWKYLIEDGRNSGRWRDMRFGDYHGKQCWLTDNWEQDVRVCRDGEVHPGVSTRVAYEWRPNVDQNVRIRVHAHKVDTRCGDGVWVGIFKAVDGQGMAEKLGEFRLGKGDKKGVTKNYKTHVAPGILIYAVVDIYRDSGCDATKLVIDVY